MLEPGASERMKNQIAGALSATNLVDFAAIIPVGTVCFHIPHAIRLPASMRDASRPVCEGHRRTVICFRHKSRGCGLEFCALLRCTVSISDR